MAHKREMQIGGKTLSLETGAIAKQAHGACVVRYGDTVVLATVVGEPNPKRRKTRDDSGLGQPLQPERKDSCQVAQAHHYNGRAKGAEARFHRAAG